MFNVCHDLSGLYVLTSSYQSDSQTGNIHACEQVARAAGFGQARGQNQSSYAQQMAGFKQGHAYQRKRSHGSTSGLQSPPCEEQEGFDTAAPTDALKSALFGSAPTQQQQQHQRVTQGVDAGIQSGMTPTPASAAAAGQLRQQVLQQLHAKLGQSVEMTNGCDAIAAHHQKAYEPFAGFARGQDVPHNARLWNLPASPQPVAGFSLHENPLADLEQQNKPHVMGSSVSGPKGQSFGEMHPHVQVQLPVQSSRTRADPVFSLSELASIDPAQL